MVITEEVNIVVMFRDFLRELSASNHGWESSYPD
jgi:hypothetical protein